MRGAAGRLCDDDEDARLRFVSDQRDMGLCSRDGLDVSPDVSMDVSMDVEALFVR